MQNNMKIQELNPTIGMWHNTQNIESVFLNFF